MNERRLSDYPMEREGWLIGTPRPASWGNASATGTEVGKLRDQLARREAQIKDLRRRLETASAEVETLKRRPVTSDVDDAIELDDSVVLQQVGIYEYHHPLENAEQYRTELRSLRERIKTLVKAKQAVLASPHFVYNNSLAQGRKMTSDLTNLMLVAYNAEVENCLRTMRVGTVETAKKRLERTVKQVSKLGSMMEMQIAPEFHELRLKELELVSDFLFKQQEEREQAKEERAQLREQRRAEAELKAERERLEREQSHYANAIQQLVDQGREDEVGDLRRRLNEIDRAIEDTDYRIANQRAGYVYVISNVGAFGANIVKIGLTRRLEPRERVDELGGASVPFPFDVHAIYFSDDAVTLENELHKAFADRRVNHINQRREFFFATPSEVRDVLGQKVGALLEFDETPEAAQYFQSQSLWPELSD